MRLLQSRLDLAQQQQDIWRQAQAEAQAEAVQVCWAWAVQADSKHAPGSGPRVLCGTQGMSKEILNRTKCACLGSACGARPWWLQALSFWW